MYNKLTNFNRPRGHEFISFGRGFHKNHKYAFSFFYTCIRVVDFRNFLGHIWPCPDHISPVKESKFLPKVHGFISFARGFHENHKYAFILFAHG